MPLYKPSELLNFLRSISLKPRRALSQNFLIDGNIIRNILRAGNIQYSDPVLEIGPGPGCLTEALLDTGAKVVALETDPKLAHALNRLQNPEKNLTVIKGDALTIPLEEIFGSFSTKEKIKLFSNLPYHITTPLITRFITRYDHFSTIIVMVQDGVAKRMASHPGTSDYGSLSLFLQFYADITYMFKVGRNCFYPVPKVDSAVVCFHLKKPSYDVDPEPFFQMIRTAFGQRRKILRNSLSELYSSELIELALKNYQLNFLTRPEELSLAQFVELYQFLNSPK